MRRYALLLLLAGWLPAQVPNVLTAEEKAAGWILLFDGATTAGWREVTGLPFPSGSWRVEDGCLRAVNPGRGFQDLRADIEVESFELRFEWKIAPGGNSGVKYLVQRTDRWTNQAGLQARARGLEYQLVDDAGSDAAAKNKSCGSLYGVIAPTRAAARPAGEFNQSALVVRGGHVEHWLNGVKVVEFETADPAVRRTLEALAGNGRVVSRGFLSLQNHGAPAWFRTLKLRRF